MELKNIKSLVDRVVERHQLKDIEKNRIFVFIVREKKPSLSLKVLGEYDINSHDCTVHYAKAKSLYKSNQDYKKIVNEILNKYDNIDVDSNNLKPLFDKVRKFRETFELKVKDKPSLLTKSEYELHYRLLKEEIDEYFESVEEGDKPNTLKELVDVLYILMGCVLNHGMQDVFEDAFNEVHASNMSKLQDEKVLKRDDGKVLKGDDYFKADMNQFI